MSSLLNTAKSCFGKKPVKIFLCTIFIPYLVFTAYGPFWLVFQSNSNTERILSSVSLCPCKISIAWNEEQFGFNIDPGCDPRKSGYWNCRFHQGAKGCYRRKSATNAAGAQCCYDNNGIWISDWKKGAGTLDFYSPGTLSLCNLSAFQHFFTDVLSYFSCCFGPSKFFSLCEEYMKYRPPGKCDDKLVERSHIESDSCTADGYC